MDDALDYLAITRLQSAYGDAVTRRAWGELELMFLPDCTLQVDLRDGTVLARTGPQEIVSFLAGSLERFEFFVFTLLNSTVDVASDGVRASGRLYLREVRQELAGHRWTTAFGLYRDRYRKVEDRWCFAARQYSSLARTSSTGDGMDVFPMPVEAEIPDPHP